jgi:glucose/arabinose dehydrogenase
MSSGLHRIQVAAVASTSAGTSQGPPSAPLTVNVVPPPGISAARAVPRSTATTEDGTALAVDTLATGLDRPSGIAAIPDGRLFVAERTGAIRVWSDGAVSPEPAALLDAAAGTDTGLVGLALDPAFVRTRRLYVAYTAKAADGSFVNRIARFRELGGRLGERASLLEDPVSGPPRRAPRISVGADGKIYAAFPASAVPQPTASYSGRLLRLNDDGTTPRDNPGLSPVVSRVGTAALAFGWQPGTGDFWRVVRDGETGREAVEHGPIAQNAAATILYPALDVSAASFYGGAAIRAFQGDLLVATLDDRQIRRLRFDAADPTRIVGSENLFHGEFGRIGDVAEGADGAVYFCTSNGPGGSTLDDRLMRVTASRAIGRAVKR